MEESEKERRALIHEYYQIYSPLQKRYGLKEHSHFDIYGNNSIEIREYGSGRTGTSICEIREDDEVTCYKRAIEILENYRRLKEESEEKTYESKAG